MKKRENARRRAGREKREVRGSKRENAKRGGRGKEEKGKEGKRRQYSLFLTITTKFVAGR